MHILIIPSEHFITQTQPLGGIFQYHQARALVNAGHKVGVLSVGYITPRYLHSKYQYKKEENINNINIKRKYQQLYFPHRFIPFNILKNSYIQMAEKLYIKYVEEFGSPDIIHAHNFLYAGLIANYIKEKYDIKYIVTEHSSSFVRNKLSDLKINAIKQTATNASSVTAVSSTFQKILKQYTNIEINLLANIVDDFFLQAPFVQNKYYDRFVFLNIASLDKNKNQKLLINAFKKIVKINNNILLKIAGEGYMKNELESLVKKLHIENQVEFLGRINQSQVREEMMNANCFILPSHYETFGVVLIEALACGLPLIATKCGGPEDIIDDNNGLLIDIDNQEQLEKAMLYMYENAKKYNRERLREDIKQRFGENAFVKKVTQYYKLGI